MSRLNDLADELHDRTCGSDSLVFRFSKLFYVECPCCLFYRGAFLGMAVGGAIGWML